MPNSHLSHSLLLQRRHTNPSSQLQSDSHWHTISTSKRYVCSALCITQQFFRRYCCHHIWWFHGHSRLWLHMYNQLHQDRFYWSHMSGSVHWAQRHCIWTVHPRCQPSSMDFPEWTRSASLHSTYLFYVPNASTRLLPPQQLSNQSGTSTKAIAFDSPTMTLPTFPSPNLHQASDNTKHSPLLSMILLILWTNALTTCHQLLRNFCAYIIT